MSSEKNAQILTKVIELRVKHAADVNETETLKGNGRLKFS